ncbi:MAG: hypothetical protein ABSC94_16775 [Polyangiaceae bacterium]|jgi:hypothetical protein
MNAWHYWSVYPDSGGEERLSILMQAYADILREHDFLRDIFGVI